MKPLIMSFDGTLVHPEVLDHLPSLEARFRAMAFYSPNHGQWDHQPPVWSLLKRNLVACWYALADDPRLCLPVLMQDHHAPWCADEELAWAGLEFQLETLFPSGGDEAAFSFDPELFRHGRQGKGVDYWGKAERDMHKAYVHSTYAYRQRPARYVANILRICQEWHDQGNLKTFVSILASNWLKWFVNPSDDECIMIRRFFTHVLGFQEEELA